MSDTDTCDVNIKGNIHHGQGLTRSTFIIFNQLPITYFLHRVAVKRLRLCRESTKLK
ncbi:hypothetical protein VCHA50P417_120104 [Vibrio chagasii]|nr:hypothetical protein VCHA35O142_110103 [Vibrio chagasii]CAH6936597.1 hypothetical protein VCHA50P417_120104 [Vibrio chagasii]CAH6980646.1 hypothetical protein VCHA48P442_120104 [Vibrio chagasii]